MRCMAELHMSFGREAVDPCPRNLDVLVSVSNNFLHLRFFLHHLGVTEHAFSDGWNAGGVAVVGANMAVDACHAKPHMGIMREGDGLPSHGCNGAEHHEPHAACGMSDRSPGSTIQPYCIFSY